MRERYFALAKTAQYTASMLVERASLFREQEAEVAKAHRFVGQAVRFMDDADVLYAAIPAIPQAAQREEHLATLRDFRRGLTSFDKTLVLLRHKLHPSPAHQPRDFSEADTAETPLVSSGSRRSIGRATPVSFSLSSPSRREDRPVTVCGTGRAR